MSEAASDAAALLTQDITEEAMSRGFHVSEDAAAHILGVAPSSPDAGTEAAPVAPQATPAAPAAETTEAEPETEFAFPSYKPVDDDEIAEYGEPDDEDDHTPPSAVVEDEPEEFEYEDPAVAELKRRLAAAEKKAAHFEGLRAQEGRKNWAKEAERRYPLATLDTITATSKRAFLRQAALSHNTNYQALKPHLDRLAEAQAKLKEQADAEARAGAIEAWGRPLTGPGVVPVEASARQDELEAARATGQLSRVLGVIRKQAERGG